MVLKKGVNMLAVRKEQNIILKINIYARFMQEDNMPLEDFIDVINVDFFKEGNIVQSKSYEEIEELAAPLSVVHMRKLVKTLADLYYSGHPPSKAEFNKLFKDSEKEMSDEVGNEIEKLELSEDFFKVEKRIVERNGDVTIKLKKLNKEDRIKIIRSIATKMVDKLSKEQLISLLEEGIRKNSDFDKLKEIDSDLDKEDVKINARKGCFKLVVNNNDIFILR